MKRILTACVIMLTSNVISSLHSMDKTDQLALTPHYLEKQQSLKEDLSWTKEEIQANHFFRRLPSEIIRYHIIPQLEIDDPAYLYLLQFLKLNDQEIEEFVVNFLQTKSKEYSPNLSFKDLFPNKLWISKKILEKAQNYINTVLPTSQIVSGIMSESKDLLSLIDQNPNLEGIIVEIANNKLQQQSCKSEDFKRKANFILPNTIKKWILFFMILFIEQKISSPYLSNANTTRIIMTTGFIITIIYLYYATKNIFNEPNSAMLHTVRNLKKKKES